MHKRIEHFLTVRRPLSSPYRHRTHPLLLLVRHLCFCRDLMTRRKGKSDASRWQRRHHRVDKSCRDVVTHHRDEGCHDVTKRRQRRPVHARKKPSFRGEEIAAPRSRSTIIDIVDNGYENYSDSRPGHVTIFGFITAIVTVALVYTYYRRGAAGTKKVYATYAYVAYGVYPDHPAPVRRGGETVIKTSTGVLRFRNSGDRYCLGGSLVRSPDNVWDLNRSVQKRAWLEV